MQKNHIFHVLQNDKKYLLSRRKLLTKPDQRSFQQRYKRFPTEASQKKYAPHPIINSLNTNLKLKSPRQKYTTEQINRVNMYAKAKPSRCSSANSRCSNVSSRFSEMRKIQNDNIRMVEKILLVKPTLQKKKQTEFFKQHKEFSRRLSRYSQTTFKGKSVNTTHRNNFSKQPSALPIIHPKKLSFKNYFKNEYTYDKNKPSYSFL